MPPRERVRGEADELFGLPPAPDGTCCAGPGPTSDEERDALANPGSSTSRVQVVGRRLTLYSSRPQGPAQAPPRVLATARRAWQRGLACSPPLRHCAWCRWRSRWRCDAARLTTAALRSVLPIAIAAPLVAPARGGSSVSARAAAGVHAGRPRTRRRQPEALPDAGPPQELQPLVGASTACSRGSPRPSRRSGISSPMWRTNCARRSPALQIGLLSRHARRPRSRMRRSLLRAGVDRATHLSSSVAGTGACRARRRRAAGDVDLAEVAAPGACRRRAAGRAPGRAAGARRACGGADARRCVPQRDATRSTTR